MQDAEETMSHHLHIEPVGGIAGDMLLAALVDLHGESALLEQLPNRLGMSGVIVEVGRTEKHKITARSVRIGASDQTQHRHLPQIREIITSADLAEKVQQNAVKVFEALAAAEAKIHNADPERIHFHEVGGDDAIVDIVGCCLYLDALAITSISCGPLPLRRGITTAAHGPIPLPAPATLELLRDWPVKWQDGEGELVTPTGAALVATLAAPGNPPFARLINTGYGAGTIDLDDRPNLVRATLYDTAAAALKGSSEPIVELVAAIDDSTGEQLGFAAEILLGAGALDAYYKALIMKKGRPGWELTVICRPADSGRLAGLVLEHTSTGGVRRRNIERYVAPRETVAVDTAFGQVHVKVFAGMNGTVHPAPEYEECKTLANQAQVPLARVQQEAIRMYWNLKGDR